MSKSERKTPRRHPGRANEERGGYQPIGIYPPPTKPPRNVPRPVFKQRPNRTSPRRGANPGDAEAGRGRLRRAMNTQEFIARIHNEEDGSLWAEVLDLPGCFASGDSLDELRDALEEAISLHLHDEFEAGAMKDAAAPRAGQMEVGEMRVKVPA